MPKPEFIATADSVIEAAQDSVAQDKPVMSGISDSDITMMLSNQTDTVFTYISVPSQPIRIESQVDWIAVLSPVVATLIL